MARNSEDHGGLLAELGTGANEFGLENDAEVIETARGRQIITTNQPGKPRHECEEIGQREDAAAAAVSWERRGVEGQKRRGRGKVWGDE